MIDETTHDVRTAVHVHGLGFGVLVLGRASGCTVFSFVFGCWCLRSLGFRVQDLGFRVSLRFWDIRDGVDVFGDAARSRENLKCAAARGALCDVPLAVHGL